MKHADADTRGASIVLRFPQAGRGYFVQNLLGNELRPGGRLLQLPVQRFEDYHKFITAEPRYRIAFTYAARELFRHRHQ